MTTQFAVAEISKETLCSTASFMSAKISPNGQHLVRIGADEAGIANAFVSAMENLSQTEKITSFQTPQIIQFFWSADSNIVLLLRDENGMGKLQLHGFHVKTKQHHAYTASFPKATTKIVRISPKRNQAVIGLNHRNPFYHDLYLLDLDSGALTLLLENNEFAKFLLDDDLRIALKVKIEPDSSWTVLSHDNEVFVRLSPEDAFQTEFLRADSSDVYFLDSRFSDTNQLTRKSLKKPYAEEILGGDTKSDVDEVLFINGIPKAYASYYTQKRWHPLDAALEADLSFLSAQVGSNFEVVNQSQNGKFWIVSNSIPDRGNLFWLYDRKNRSLKQLSPSSHFPQMYEMVTSSRDGKELVCYYTLPKEFDRGGTIDSPLPLVVLPHCGPFKVRDKYEFNLYHQWLANLGYVVLSVNFRLSSGFGKAFVNAGNGEWGGKAHLDVIDAVEACIAKGIADRAKLAIFGGSYGGYESLAALTFTPNYFKCCVSVCGPSNLKTVLDGVPQFWEFTDRPAMLSDKLNFFTKAAFITSMGGHPDDPSGIAYLQKCSPLNHLDQIQVPLLIVHGKNDHIVLERESEQVYRKMKEDGKEVTYILFTNEGHRFGYFANKLMLLDQAEYFLSQHLGGKYWPVNPSQITGTTGQIFH